MSTQKNILNVTVGETLSQAGSRAASAMRAAQSGAKIAPYFGVSFADIGQMLSTFTPKRWNLIATLRQAGPISIAALARQLQRDYKNVHADVTQLMQWMAVERDETGRVHVPWTDLVIYIKLPE